MITAFQDSWVTISGWLTLRNPILDVTESGINAFITVNGLGGDASNRSRCGPSPLRLHWFIWGNAPNSVRNDNVEYRVCTEFLQLQGCGIKVEKCMKAFDALWQHPDLGKSLLTACSFRGD